MAIALKCSCHGFQMAHARTGYVVWGKGLNSIMWVKKRREKKERAKRLRGSALGRPVPARHAGRALGMAANLSLVRLRRSGHRPTVSRFGKEAAVLGISPLPLPLFDNATKSFTSLDHLTGLVCWWWWFSIVNFLHSFLKIQPRPTLFPSPKQTKKEVIIIAPPPPSPLHTHTHAPTHIPTPPPPHTLTLPPPPPTPPPDPIYPRTPTITLEFWNHDNFMFGWIISSVDRFQDSSSHPMCSAVSTIISNWPDTNHSQSGRPWLTNTVSLIQSFQHHKLSLRKRVFSWTLWGENFTDHDFGNTAVFTTHFWPTTHRG